jgi:curved DNA-binding protein CbpA
MTYAVDAGPENMAAPDYYALLGVPRNATTAEVRKAFRGKALEQHPDRGGDEESFRLLSKAYDVLSDSERRKYYDRTGRPERTAEDDFLDGFGKKTADTPKRDESAALAQRLDASHEESHAKSFEAWMRSRRPRCPDLVEAMAPSRDHVASMASS